MYKELKVSLVIPCYNEEKGIEAVIRKVPYIIDEIVIIDNASTDKTAKIARELGARVVSEPKRGYGAAYKKGFQEALGDVIVTLDGDGMYPIETIPYLIGILVKENIDFITIHRKNEWIKKISAWTWSNWLRYLGNHFISFSVYIIFGLKLRDSQSGMWIFRKKILRDLRLTSDGWPFSEEIKIEAFLNKKFKTVEIPQPYYNKRFGTSKLNIFRDGFVNVVFLFKKRFGIR